MYTTATPCAVRSRITRKRVWTSCWSSAAEGSSITISRVSWESARAMLTICCPDAGSVPTSRSARISEWPSRASSERAALRVSARLTIPPRDFSCPRKMFSATVSPATRSSSW